MKIEDVLILKDAVTDLDDGKLFYNKQGRSVGDYFWDTLLSDIESLVVYAGIHRKKYGYYQMFSKRFPYAVYYEIKNEIVYVVAVLPMRKDPAWIRKQIKERS